MRWRRMTRKEAIEKIKMILAECAEDEDAVCYVTFDDADALDMAIKALEQEQKTGQWIFVDKAHEHAHCSECGYGNVDLFNGRPHNYCPNCGAKWIRMNEN